MSTNKTKISDEKALENLILDDNLGKFFKSGNDFDKLCLAMNQLKV